MKCTGCGKDLGFWEKLGNHSQVCKACAEQGQNRLKVLATSVGCVANWNQQHAQGWLAQYDEILHKYQVPAAEATQRKNEILNAIFKLVESQEQMADIDLEYLVGLGKRYDTARSGSPELQDTILRIALRKAIQTWDSKKLLERECTTLVLTKGEVCHWEEPAGLLVQRTKREYVGGYGSVSIPLHIVRGARIRVGGFKGVPIDKTVHEDGGRGLLHITNQRVCFTGQDRAVAIPLKKIVSLAGFDGGFEVHTGDEKKPGIFLVPHPELTIELLKCASSSKDDDHSRPKRRRKVPMLTMAVFAVLLSSTALGAGQNAPPSGDSAKSLGDIARANQVHNTASAQVPPKHVYTDDDVQHGGYAAVFAHPKTSDDQKPIMDVPCEVLAVVVLKGVNPKYDKDFPGRGTWEQDLCRAREDWHRQWLRWEGHVGTSTEGEEHRLEQNALSNLQAEGLRGTDLARQFLAGGKTPDRVQAVPQSTATQNNRPDKVPDHHEHNDSCPLNNITCW
jgi:hypothetical protein